MDAHDATTPLRTRLAGLSMLAGGIVLAVPPFLGPASGSDDTRSRLVYDAAHSTTELAKSLVFLADGEPVVIVASGAHRVDVDQLALACDCAVIEKATPADVRAATGFAVGGVPPFGHGLPVMIDAALLEYDLVYAAGGDGNTLFAVDPRKLAEATNARTVTVAELAA